MTIRRDLDLFEKQGFIRRYYGGAGMYPFLASPAAKVAACSSARPTSNVLSGNIFLNSISPVLSSMAAPIGAQAEEGPPRFGCAEDPRVGHAHSNRGLPRPAVNADQQAQGRPPDSGPRVASGRAFDYYNIIPCIQKRRIFGFIFSSENFCHFTWPSRGSPCGWTASSWRRTPRC